MPDVAADYTGNLSVPKNNCNDSARSWAQVYTRTLDLMGGARGASGTDVNGQTPMPRPVFGNDACGDGEFDGKVVTTQKNEQVKEQKRLVYGAFSNVLGGPLSQSTTGNRTFDYNTDGVAHYGMVPDMIADLENIGMDTAALDDRISCQFGHAGQSLSVRRSLHSRQYRCGHRPRRYRHCAQSALGLGFLRQRSLGNHST